MRDVHGVEGRKHRHIEDMGRRLARNWGFEDIKTPILERNDVFLRTLGQNSEVVSKVQTRNQLQAHACVLGNVSILRS